MNFCILCINYRTMKQKQDENPKMRNLKISFGIGPRFAKVPNGAS